MVLWGKDKDQQMQEQRREEQPSDLSKENHGTKGTLHQGTSCNCNCGDGNHTNGLHKV